MSLIFVRCELGYERIRAREGVFAYATWTTDVLKPSKSSFAPIFCRPVSVVVANLVSFIKFLRALALDLCTLGILYCWSTDWEHGLLIDLLYIETDDGGVRTKFILLYYFHKMNWNYAVHFRHWIRREFSSWKGLHDCLDSTSWTKE